MALLLHHHPRRLNGVQITLAICLCFCFFCFDFGAFVFAFEALDAFVHNFLTLWIVKWLQQTAAPAPIATTTTVTGDQQRNLPREARWSPVRPAPEAKLCKQSSINGKHSVGNVLVCVCSGRGRVCSLLAIMNSNWTEHLLQLLFAMQNTVDTREVRTKLRRAL